MTTETDPRSCRLRQKIYLDCETGDEASTNGDLFTQVKLIHYLSTSTLPSPPSLVCHLTPPLWFTIVI